MNSIQLTQSELELVSSYLAIICFVSISAGLLAYDFFRFVMRCIGHYYQIDARIKLKIRQIRLQRARSVWGQK